MLITSLDLPYLIYTKFKNHEQLKKNYPGAKVKVVYEAGFAGFTAQRTLSELGIDCIIVNRADVPTRHKENKQKDNY